MSEAHCSIRIGTFASIEGLRSPIAGSSIELVQLADRSVSGGLLKAAFGEMQFSQGHFTGSVRASGVFSHQDVTLGLLLDQGGPVRVANHEVAVGNVMINPPGAEHDCIYSGSTVFAGLSLPAASLVGSFCYEPGLADGAFWTKPCCVQPEPRIAAEIRHRILEVSALLAKHGDSLASDSIAYWRHEILQAFINPILRTVPDDITHLPSPLKLVREVEAYLSSSAYAPVHLSEICSALCVSRRTLHRAFHDVLGIGPIDFLRRKRLCDAHAVLCRGDLRARVTDVAISFGFSEMGRFAGYYMRLFSEHPSETLRRSRAAEAGARLDTERMTITR